MCLTIVKQIRISRKIVARSLLGSGRTEIREYLNETRVSKLTLADPYRSIFSFFLHTGCNCIRRHKSLLVAPGITGVPSESWTEGERERESKCLSGKEGEGGERSRGKERGRDMGGEILLYTVCIITLRCTCELFPPRLTRPIHNRVTGVKVLPVIAVAAPRTSPNIVRPPIYHLYPATL